MKIIYLDNGFLCVVNPSIEALEQMTIEELAQKIIPEKTSFRIVEDDFFPVDNEYRDAWTIAEDLTGNIFIDQDKVDVIRLTNFPVLTRRQFMRSLVMNELDLDHIKMQISAIEDTQMRQLALIDWEYSTEFSRSDETLLMVGALLGLTDEKIDEMWEQALTL